MKWILAMLVVLGLAVGNRSIATSSNSSELTGSGKLVADSSTSKKKHKKAKGEKKEKAAEKKEEKKEEKKDQKTDNPS